MDEVDFCQLLRDGGKNLCSGARMDEVEFVINNICGVKERNVATTGKIEVSRQRNRRYRAARSETEMSSENGTGAIDGIDDAGNGGMRFMRTSDKCGC